MIYRVSIKNDGHEGYKFYSSKSVAETYRQAYLDDLDDIEFDCTEITIDSVPTPKTKADVILLLEKWASHPDNG